jgi:hypothetical protein
MATYYFRNTGTGVWGLASNWSLTSGGGATGAIPTATDTAVFDNNSISCTLNTSNRVCQILSATTYTQTLNLSTFNLTVSGNINLGSAMTLTTTTGSLVINANSTITTNTKTMTVPFNVSTGGVRLTFADNFVLLNTLTIFGTLASPITAQPNSSMVQRKFTITQGITYSIDYCVAVDLDSGDGLTAWNYKGTQTNCVNWKDLPTQPPPIFEIVGI